MSADPGRGETDARWSLDLVHDQFVRGRRFRVLNIIDDVTREWLAAIPDTSISGRRVARELTDRISRRGKPDIINSDHGTEFTLNAILAWSKDHCMEWHYIAPGKLIQNGYVESFNGRMAMSLRIPMKPAMHSDAMPATHSDFMPAGIPI